ncbi:alpha-amylase family glycosyl hydrolase [Telluribacter sp.]|jgi:alpha-glucosidase|uniref:alpha-amylase family glycosyl hydrolase n=1 Tax=Telluribacter sp. TaxID=1978767 RepID=UPI002E12A38B|nr:alpha-amylase family glycosyl hydrolase [Telluribacter sp.]
MSETNKEYLWWQKGIVYQIYPRSYQDSNGDGVGDLKGILQRLDYLEWLGVEAIWISPIFPSPMADFGYDISDYTGIHPLFGSMDDFDDVLREVHRRGIKLLLDLVPNHSSDQHPWFQESRSSKDSPKRDWYIWHDALEDGSPPNNWLAMFGGTAWEWDENTQQYYYHAFLKEQPDLNWRNPEVQQAMLDVMRFWLDKGVDGFRVDVMWHMIKDVQLRDNPINLNFNPKEDVTYNRLSPVYSTDQPEIHDIVRMMRALTDEYQERVIIGEIYLPVHQLVAYYGQNGKGAHLPFNFQLISLPWDPLKIATSIDEYEGALPEGGWPNWVLGNHDNSRIASKVGLDQARVAATLLLTLRGTPTLYYGDEIGMRDVPIPPDKVQDPQGLNMPELDVSRDPERTPMQWDESPNAGFSEAEPWLPLPKNYSRVNVERQRKDEHSMLLHYRKLISLRRKEPALHVGTYKPVFSNKQIIAYLRESDNRRFLIVLNLSHRSGCFLPKGDPLRGEVVLGTEGEREGSRIEHTIEMGGDEAIIVLLDS